MNKWCYFICLLPILLLNRSWISNLYLIFLFNIPLCNYIYKKKSKLFVLLYLIGLLAISVGLFIWQIINLIHSDLSQLLDNIASFVYPVLVCVANAFVLYLKYSESPNKNQSHMNRSQLKMMLYSQGFKDLSSILITGIAAISFPSIWNAVFLLVFFIRCFLWKTRKNQKTKINGNIISIFSMAMGLHVFLLFVIRGTVSQHDQGNQWLKVIGLSYGSSEKHLLSIEYWINFIYPTVSAMLMYVMYASYMVDSSTTTSTHHTGSYADYVDVLNKKEDTIPLDEMQDSEMDDIGGNMNNMSYYFFGSLANYSLQISVIATCVTSVIQANLFSIVQIVPMILHWNFRSLNKRVCALIYMIVLTMVMVIKYSLYVFRNQIFQGIGLLYFTKFTSTNSNTLVLIAEVFQLAMAAYHYQVQKYRITQSSTRRSPNIEDVIGKDYISSKSTLGDLSKYFLYCWFHWVSLSFILFTGLINYNFMGIIYLIFFLFSLICYKDIVTKYKNWFKSWDLMWFLGLVFVTIKIIQIHFPFSIKYQDTSSSIIFDAICVMLITIQVRIFENKSFWYVVLHLQIEKSLKSKGSQIVKLLSERYDQQWLERENLVKAKLCAKVDRIKEKQKQCGYPPLDNLYIFLRSGNYYFPEVDPADDDEDLMAIMNGKVPINENLEDADEEIAFTSQLMITIPEDRIPYEDFIEPEPRKKNWFLRQLETPLTYLSHWMDMAVKDYNKASEILQLDREIIRQGIINEINELGVNPLKYNFNILGGINQIQGIPNEINNLNFEKDKEVPGIFSSLKNFLLTYSDSGCYIWIILNCMLSSSISKVLFPLFTSFWVFHAAPIPSKVIWYILTFYTMVTLIANYIFQWSFINFNDYVQMIWGFQISNGYFIFDVVQLLLIFIHCTYLQHLGQWENQGDQVSHESIFAKLSRFWKKARQMKKISPTDVYPYAFICELICVIIIVVEYKSFVPIYTNSSKFNFLTEKVALPLLGMIMLQFAIIVFDWCLVLKRSVWIRFLFQISYLLAINTWLTVGLQEITHKTLINLIGPIFFYIFKCFNIFLSLYQIKQGYPVVRTKNFLTLHYNPFCFVTYKLYMVIPYIHYFKMCLQWSFSNSPLGVAHWNHVEEIYKDIYSISFWRNRDKTNGFKRGDKPRLCYKICNWILIFLLIVVIPFGPPIIMVIINSTMVSNPLEKCEMSLSIGNLKPIFTYTSQDGDVGTLSKNITEAFPECFSDDLDSKSYFHNFGEGDINELKINKLLSEYWNSESYSTSRLEALIKDRNFKMSFHFKIKCKRAKVDKNTKDVFYENKVYLTGKEKDMAFDALFKGDQKGINITQLIPKFLTAHENSMTQTEILTDKFVVINLKFESDQNQPLKTTKITGINTSSNFCPQELNNNEPDNLFSIIIFNERVSKNAIGRILKRYTIPMIWLYGTYFFLVYRLFVAYFSRQYLNIFHEEMANPSRIKNILNDIYLSREYKLQEFEELFVSKLFYIYQSQENILKWTTEKRENLERFSKKLI